MGSALSAPMEKNQEKMLAAQREMAMKQREMQMATQLALARDNLKWFAGFYTVTALGLFRSFHTSKNPALIAPLIPLTFALVFQADVAAGRKMERVRREADKILEKEGALFVPPVHNRLMPIEEYKKLFGIKE